MNGRARRSFDTGRFYFCENKTCQFLAICVQLNQSKSKKIIQLKNSLENKLWYYSHVYEKFNIRFNKDVQRTFAVSKHRGVAVALKMAVMLARIFS